MSFQNEMEHLTEQEIAQCADALLLGKYDTLPVHLKEHLSSCDSCATEVAVVAELSGDIGYNVEETKTAGKRRSLWVVVLTSAVASLALLLIGNYFLGNPKETGWQTALHYNAASDTTGIATTREDVVPHAGEEKPAPGQKKPAKAREEQKQLLAYALHADLEKLADNFKGAYRGNDVSVITPHELVCSPADSLKWNNTDKISLSVEFYNNKGVMVNTAQTTESSLALPRLSPGLYYWKLMNDDFDLLFCGKLIVKAGD